MGSGLGGASCEAKFTRILMGYRAFGDHELTVGESRLSKSRIPVKRASSGLGAGLIREGHQLLGLGLEIFKLGGVLRVGRQRGDREGYQQNQSQIGLQKAHI